MHLVFEIDTYGEILLFSSENLFEPNMRIRISVEGDTINEAIPYMLRVINSIVFDAEDTVDFSNALDAARLLLKQNSTFHLNVGSIMIDCEFVHDIVGHVDARLLKTNR